MTTSLHFYSKILNNFNNVKSTALPARIKKAAIVLAFSSILLIPGCGSSEDSASGDGKPGKASEAAPATGPDASAVQKTPANQTAQSKIPAAMKRAKERNRFLVTMFTGGKAGPVSAMKDSLSAAMDELAGKADTLMVDAKDPAEQKHMRKYGVGSRGGLPMVLVMAPNGAVTGGYPGSVSTKQLVKSVSTSKLMQKVLKPLQKQKVVLVALQNAATKHNSESWAGVNDFANDAKYRQQVFAIKADPSAPGSKDFVKQCQLTAPITQATVVVLLPPGRIGTVLTGKLTKADVLKALGSCASGCGPGGCSDRRFKENIRPIESALEKVTTLQGVTFNWNRKDYPQRFFTDEPQIGVIAQDVETVIPEVVHTDKEGFKSVEYDKLTAVLIEAVKELNTKHAIQDSLIQAQNARIKTLETK